MQLTANTLAKYAPFVFVLLWSTGYITAKFGLPYAPPFTFLALRMFFATMFLTLIATVSKTPWPKPNQWKHAAIAGLLLHGGYLGGLFTAIHLGITAGISSVIVNLQPVLVASVAARFLGEAVSRRQWLGFVLGLLGVVLVIAEKFFGALRQPVPVWGMVACVVALLSSTFGTVYQKKFGSGIPLLMGTATQYFFSGLVFCVLAVFTEQLFDGPKVQWTNQFVFALFWFVLVISLGAILLLLWLIRHSSASRVSSYMYLVPPLTAVEAYFLFNEKMGAPALLGLLLTALGVALVQSS